MIQNENLTRELNTNKEILSHYENFKNKTEAENKIQMENLRKEME